MRLATIHTTAGPAPALLRENRLLDLAAASARVGPAAADLGGGVLGIVAAGQSALDAVQNLADRAASHEELWSTEPDVRFLPPVIHPPRIFCLGRNYVEHAREGKADVPTKPMIFLKPASALTGHREPIVLADSTDQVDWEGELGVVVGTGGREIEQEDALDAIAGYVVANDVTARDWQRRTSQFDSGKMFDTFAPTGPWLVTRDEVADPAALSVITRVNGEVMQEGKTRDMVFTVPYLISYLSHAVRLRPGDIILTGTPAGVGYARTPPIFLKDGDVVEVSISEVGVLTNPVWSAERFRREHPEW